jgi:hypothetical protein
VSNAPFQGLTDPSGFDIGFVEFVSPVWTGTGYAAGITVSRSGSNPTDRPRCTSAEVVGENWRFLMQGHGAVLVANANIKFIWTVAPEVLARKSEDHQEGMALPESLRDIAHMLHKKPTRAEHGNLANAPGPAAMFQGTVAPVETPEPPKEPEPDPAAHFKVENPPRVESAAVEEAPDAPKKRRGRPPGAKNKPKPAE